jgi:arginase
MKSSHPILSYASGLAGPDVHCGDGPRVICNSTFLAQLSALDLAWVDEVSPEQTTATKLEQVAQMCHRVAQFTHEMTEQQRLFLVLGGDHSCAMGTWSGVKSALPVGAQLGLLWIDAHLDSHTPQTTLTGNIHGMPLAALLGHGAKELTNISAPAPVLLPAYVRVLGVRSYESQEMALISRLKVPVYEMPEIHRRGFATVLAEALHDLKQQTPYVGISFDIDAIDPHDAPGVSTPARNGLLKADVLAALQQVMAESPFLGAEIVEFNPQVDHDRVTEQLVIDLMSVLLKQK